jgi:hypothetical protein
MTALAGETRRLRPGVIFGVACWMRDDVAATQEDELGAAADCLCITATTDPVTRAGWQRGYAYAPTACKFLSLADNCAMAWVVAWDMPDLIGVAEPGMGYLRLVRVDQLIPPAMLTLDIPTMPEWAERWRGGSNMQIKRLGRLT